MFIWGIFNKKALISGFNSFNLTDESSFLHFIPTFFSEILKKIGKSIKDAIVGVKLLLI